MTVEIPLLQPLVLLGVVEKLQASETHTLLNRFKPVSHPFPTASWEIVRGSRSIAVPNVPNSEAHIVPRLGRTSASASFIYLREKKVFEPTTLHWLAKAAVSTTAELAVKENAEKAVLREVKDLNERFDNFAEYSFWQALTGKISLDNPYVQAEIDYKFEASHLPTASTPWATATATQIVADVEAWTQLGRRDGRVVMNEAFLTQKTMNKIFNAFVGDGATQGAMLSDRMKDEYYRTGTLEGFMGLNWKIQDAVFDPAGGAYEGDFTYPSEDTKFLADDKVIFANLTTNTPVELLEGPTADDSAPLGHTGKFIKSWKEQDPSARQVLLEWNFLPVVTRPEQIVTASVGA